MRETWAPVVGFEDRYTVSTLGRIRGPQGHYLSPNNNGVGYMSVQLGRKNRRYIHRIVAEAFLGAVIPFEVNHKNFDKADNSLSNLELVNHSQNQRHAVLHGRHNKAKLCFSDIQRIHNLKSQGVSNITIAKLLNVSKSTISSIINKRTWSCLSEV